MQERRNNDRLLCAELVEVCWNYDGRQLRRVANLEDISRSGVCLQMEKGLRPDTCVSIRYGDGTLLGVVRYCVYRGLGYFVGIELEPGSRWSTQHFEPEHLLDPRELLQNTLMKRALTKFESARPQ